MGRVIKEVLSMKTIRNIADLKGVGQWVIT